MLDIYIDESLLKCRAEAQLFGRKRGCHVERVSPTFMLRWDQAIPRFHGSALAKVT